MQAAAARYLKVATQQGGGVHVGARRGVGHVSTQLRRRPREQRADQALGKSSFGVSTHQGLREVSRSLCRPRWVGAWLRRVLKRLHAALQRELCWAAPLSMPTSRNCRVMAMGRIEHHDQHALVSFTSTSRGHWSPHYFTAL